MKKQKGFSLIELLIVVAIILIIAAIAIPNLLKSRIAANESSAVASERTIATAEITYYTSNNNYASVPGLGPTAGAGLIDKTLESGTKSGYNFKDADVTTTTFNVYADPVTAGTTGVRFFCVTEDAVLKANTASTATHAGCIALNPMGN